ncbi:YbjN domain-containing protein [Cryptosporangium aurantiacum]|uniref:Putative sensory transduction regulator n=1 Tax=Cryptosporangium aurantiacum TaxID=134849 RepID=A0A1M7RHL9_9ACTN|nr:YbjN domain-containing protein [Cryptosporangium aurantiacum]SHN45649.1 Putative sensory transduction regulator [Cryptosporangium aurantiacum]
MATKDELTALVEEFLKDRDAEYERTPGGDFVVTLPGTRKQKTLANLVIGDHSLRVEAFVMRHPDENREELHAWLLTRNARMYAVSFSIDKAGDVYLTGRLPLSSVTPDELDRILGAVLEYSDGSFNTMLEIGFPSAIRREWAWRVKRGESLANLQAFADWAGSDAPA